MDIEGYKIHRKIGEGAMASVYLADQVSLGRQVALKVLAPALAAQQRFTQRFLKEGKIIAYLKHPQIVNVYDLGSHRHHYFLSMEFLSGGTLEQKIKSGLSTAQSVQIIKKIGQALSCAHDNGVIHRDIKSQNIMFRHDDVPVLTDFGIARLMDNDPQLTIPGRAIGSPLYMSPEQICGLKIDARADLYSVGILFYKMLTNTMPYQSNQILTVAMMHKTAPIPVLCKDLSLFQPVLNRLLAKDPDQRYSSAQELIEVLNQLESGGTDLLRLGSNLDSRYTQPKHCMPAAGKANIPWAGQLSQTDLATQALFGAQSMGADMGARTQKKSDAHKRSDEKIQALNNDLPRLTKGKAMGKIGLVIGGALSVLVAGIFLSNYNASPSSAPPKHATTLRLKTTKENVVFRGPIPDTLRDVRIAGPQDDHLAPSLEMTPHTQPDPDQKIAELMAKAQRQLEKYNLTSPAGDNCYDTYQQLLSLDPSGQGARSILFKIGKAYHALAAAAKAKGNLHQSLVQVGKGLALLPEDSSLLAMQDELHAKLAEQNRILQERAMRIEQEKKKRAAELASMQKRLENERQLEALRLQEAERERLDTSGSDPEITEPQKAKIEIEPSESTEKSSDNRKRLFGTF